MTNEPIIINEKKALLDLCLRNALRYARGETKYTMDLDAQLRYAYQHCGENTRQVLKTLFDIVRFDDTQDFNNTGEQ